MIAAITIVGLLCLVDLLLTSGGTVVTGPGGLRLAGFFSSSCSACPERVAPFIAYARTNRLASDEVLAVLLVGDGDEPPHYAHDLAEVAQVSAQPFDCPVTKAFGVTGYPAFCLLDADGVVVSSGFDPAALPALAMA